MKFSRADADVYLPPTSQTLSPEAALARTTHLCVIAHQDDIEINADAAVAECYERTDRFFTGVVMTNGAGSARTGRTRRFSPRMQRTRPSRFHGQWTSVHSCTMKCYPRWTLR